MKDERQSRAGKGPVLEFLAVSANELSADLCQAWKEPFMYSTCVNSHRAKEDYKELQMAFALKLSRVRGFRNGGRRDKMRLCSPKMLGCLPSPAPEGGAVVQLSEMLLALCIF